MENERLARVEESMKTMGPRVERIENKLDVLIEKSSFRWGMIIGVSGLVSFLSSALVEMFRR